MSRAVPANWSDAELSDLVSVCRPRSHPQEFPDMPFVGMDNVEPHTMRLLGTVPAGTMRSNATHFSSKDVLYGRLRPYLNKVLAPGFEGLASAEFIPLTPEPGIERDFVRYRINAVDFVSFTSRLDEGDRPRVDWDGIRQFKVYLPPRPEQRRIVEALDSYLTRLDDAVASLQRVQAKLKAYRASVLKAAVEGRLVPTDASLARAEKRDYESADVLLARILKERRRRWEEVEFAKLKAAGKAPKDEWWKAKYQEPAAPDTSTLPELPEGWDWASLEQLLRLLRNGQPMAPREEAGVRTLRISAVRPLAVDFQDVRYLPGEPVDYEDDLIEVDDLLFTRYNGTPSLVGVCGRVRLLTEPTVHPDKLIKVRLCSGLHVPYVELAANVGESRGLIERRTRTTAGQAGISGSDLKQMPIPLPPFAEQVRISDEVERLVSIADGARAAAMLDERRCARLRQSILKWAFEGKLVDQDPDDEPAQALLDRIRASRTPATRKPRRRADGSG